MSVFFLWSRSVKTDSADYATLILYDGSTSYLNWYGSCWKPHGVAADHFGGRGVMDRLTHIVRTSYLMMVSVYMGRGMVTLGKSTELPVMLVVVEEFIYRFH